MSLLEKKLTKKWADDVITDNNRLIIAIIHDLQEVGKGIAEELELKDYEGIEQFLDEHDHGKSPLDVLEGKADARGALRPQGMPHDEAPEVRDGRTASCRTSTRG